MRPLVGILLLVFAVTPALGQQPVDDSANAGPAFSVEADLNRAFIWRGIQLYRGLMLQPSATAAWRGFSLTAWANVIADDRDGLAEAGLNEVDFILAYAAELGRVALEPSFTGYIFPRDQDSIPNTGELALNLSCPLGPVSLVSDHIVDVAEYRGGYFGDIGICYEAELSPRLSAASYGYLRFASRKFNESYPGLSKATLSLADFGIGLTYSFSRGLAITPHMEANYIIDSELRDYLVKNPVNFGLKLGFEF